MRSPVPEAGATIPGVDRSGTCRTSTSGRRSKLASHVNAGVDDRFDLGGGVRDLALPDYDFKSDNALQNMNGGLIGAAFGF